MAATRFTPRQREVLSSLSKYGAFSSEKARWVPGFDEVPAEKLVARGVLNKRYDSTLSEVYWIRADSEPATGTGLLTGFVVTLRRDLTTPSGKNENFFLARAPYDGKSATFRLLLQVWMRTLGLRNRDLLGGAGFGFETIKADSPAFDGDHVILDQHKGDPP